MKELWIEIGKKLAAPPSKIIDDYFDVVIDSGKATFWAIDKNKQVDIVSPNKGERLENANVKNEILRICISDKETENQIVEAAELGASYLIISCANWRVIPLENLIARIKGKSKLIAEVTTAEEAKIALETLELGTDGVLLKTSDSEEILKAVAVVKPEALKLEMAVAKIISTKPISTGA